MAPTDDELDRMSSATAWASDAKLIGTIKLHERAAELARLLRSERRLSDGLTGSIETARKLLELVADNIRGIAETLKRFE
jgi:hypothetical protein